MDNGDLDSEPATLPSLEFLSGGRCKWSIGTTVLKTLKTLSEFGQWLNQPDIRYQEIGECSHWPDNIGNGGNGRM